MSSIFSLLVGTSRRLEVKVEKKNTIGDKNMETLEARYFIGTTSNERKNLFDLSEIKGFDKEALVENIQGQFFFDEEKLGLRKRIVKRTNKKYLVSSEELIIVEKYGDIISAILFKVNNDKNILDLFDGTLSVDLSKLEKGLPVTVFNYSGSTATILAIK